MEGCTKTKQYYYFNPDRNNAAHTGWLNMETGDWYYFDVLNDQGIELESFEKGFGMMHTSWFNNGGNEYYYL